MPIPSQIPCASATKQTRDLPLAFNSPPFLYAGLPFMAFRHIFLWAKCYFLRFQDKNNGLPSRHFFHNYHIFFQKKIINDTICSNSPNSGNGGGNSLGYQCLTSPKSVLGVGLGFDANAGLLRVTNE